MALAASFSKSQPCIPRSAKAQLQLLGLKSQDNNGESDSTLFKQFEQMLHKVLKQTSDHITDKLTHEIRELGQRTAYLEVRVDELETHTQLNLKTSRRKT